MASAGKITVLLKAEGFEEFISRIEAATSTLESLMARVAMSQICGILEVAARERIVRSAKV